MKSGYYMADTTNGVYYTGEDPDCNYGELSPDQFYYRLENLPPGEWAVLQARFDLSFDDEALLLQKIENEYGIH